MCSLIDRRERPSFRRIYPLKRSSRIFRPTESGDEQKIFCMMRKTEKNSIIVFHL